MTIRRQLTTFFLTCLLASPVLALGANDYSLEVLVDGRPLTEYAARGTHYIEALRGRDYTLRFTNRTGRRVAVALSVDGLNTIDAGTTSAQGASKWVVEPWGTIHIAGWQTSGGTARRFFFTTEERSYGDWLGETENLGIVQAAVFQEKRRPLPPPPRFTREQGGARRDSSERQKSAAEPMAPSSEADDYAATGIGEEIDHQVVSVEFEAESRAAAVLSLRYEFREQLVRLGVLPSAEDRLSRRERARGFAPDPYR